MADETRAGLWGSLTRIASRIKQNVIARIRRGRTNEPKIAPAEHDIPTPDFLPNLPPSSGEPSSTIGLDQSPTDFDVTLQPPTLTITQETDIAAAYHEAEIQGHNEQIIVEVLTLAVEQAVLDILENWRVAEERVTSAPANLRGRFHFDADADKHAPELVRDCLANMKDKLPDFDEWFHLAYALKLVTSCTVDNGRVYVMREGRSFLWEEVVAKLSLAQLRKIYVFAQAQAALEQCEANVKQAEAFVHLPIVHERLCSAFKNATNNVFEIAKVEVPILVPLAIAGTITLPLTPVLIAGGATFIDRVSVASFCSEQK